MPRNKACVFEALIQFLPDLTASDLGSFSAGVFSILFLF